MRIARTNHFPSRAKITTDDTRTDGESVRGKPMDRLLAVLARLISQRSFREECVSEVAPARRGCVRTFAPSVRQCCRVPRGRVECHGTLATRETASLKDVAT